MSKKKETNEEKEAKVHKDLKGLSVTVDSFGEVKTNLDIDKINAFLDENVEDKKLINREDEEENDDENK